jgi:Zn-finger protein
MCLCSNEVWSSIDTASADIKTRMEELTGYIFHVKEKFGNRLTMRCAEYKSNNCLANLKIKKTDDLSVVIDENGCSLIHSHEPKSRPIDKITKMVDGVKV